MNCKSGIKFVRVAVLCAAASFLSFLPAMAGADGAAGAEKAADSAVPAGSSKTPAEQYPINGDIDVYVPDTGGRAPAARPAEEVSPVDSETKSQIKKQLEDLYGFYKNKNLDGVLGALHEMIESSALEYAGRHKDDAEAAEKIRYAYKAFHRDIFNHKDYILDPFTLEFCTYNKLSNGNVEVVSPVPIIGSKSMDFTEETEETIHYMTVSLRLGRFVFSPFEDPQHAGRKIWKISEMDLF